MTWQFYGGTLDPEKFTRENVIFGIAVDPSKIATMLDGLEDLVGGRPGAAGRERAASCRRTGRGSSWDRTSCSASTSAWAIASRCLASATSGGSIWNLKSSGRFPPVATTAWPRFNRDYFNNEMDSYERRTGRKHPLADRRMNLVWLKVSNTEDFTRVAAQIESSPLFSNPAVKCETASSGIASFLDAFRDLIWGMRWLLAPACILTLSMLIANAIGISVRERRMEMAMLKVIGFRPYQILLLVLTRVSVAGHAGGTAERRADLHDRQLGIRRSEVPDCLLRCVPDSGRRALVGRGIGALAALVGSLVPAWSACRVKVVDVFSKVA